MSFTIDSILGHTLPSNPAPHSDIPSTSSAHSSTPSVDEEGSIAEEEIRYFGRKEKSKFGKNDVLIYAIPGSNSRCYSFSLKRKNSKHDAYYCIGCHKNGKGVLVDVIKEEFMADPCMLPHVCLPKEVCKDRASRFTYEKLMGIKNNPREAIRGPRQHWQEALVSISSMEGFSEAEREKIEDHFYGAGPSQRRHAFSRSEQPQGQEHDNGERSTRFSSTIEWNSIHTRGV
ncbi:hypothetical protein Aduo_002685 [Ancylostoma duodenale]